MKKLDFNLNPGVVIRGKWSGTSYTIVRKLGKGACGVVYLCRDEQAQPLAIKVGVDSSRMMLEVNMLKKFSKVQGVKLGPSFVEVDDWRAPNHNVYPFYVMEYVHGQPLPVFLKGKSKDWVGILALQLLGDLEHLHQAGYVYGDLKTDNLLIGNSKVRWIDVGGVTQIGRAIKEYTEFYDRGYWGLGGRKAEPAYDLFSVTMIMMEMAYPSKFERGADPKKTLSDKLRASTVLQPYRSFIEKGWAGKYKDATQMRLALASLMMKREPGGQQVTRKQRKKIDDLPETRELLTLSVVTIAFLGMSVLSIIL